MTDEYQMYWGGVIISNVAEIGCHREVDDIATVEFKIKDTARALVATWKTRSNLKQLGIMMLHFDGTNYVQCFLGRPEYVESTVSRIIIHCRGMLTQGMDKTIDQNFVKDSGTIASIAGAGPYQITTSMTMPGADAYNGDGVAFTDLTEPTATVVVLASAGIPYWQAELGGETNHDAVTEVNTYTATQTSNDVLHTWYAQHDRAAFEHGDISQWHFCFTDYEFTYPDDGTVPRRVDLINIEARSYKYGTAGWEMVSPMNVKIYNWTAQSWEPVVIQDVAGTTLSQYTIPRSGDNAGAYYDTATRKVKIRILGGCYKSVSHNSYYWGAEVDYLSLTVIYHLTEGILDAPMLTITDTVMNEIVYVAENPATYKIVAGDGIAICMQNVDALTILCNSFLQQVALDIEDDGKACNRNVMAANSLTLVRDICKVGGLHIYLTHTLQSEADDSGPGNWQPTLKMKSLANFDDNSVTITDDDVDPSVSVIFKYTDDVYGGVRIIGGRARFGDVSKDIFYETFSTTCTSPAILTHVDAGILSTSDAKAIGDALKTWFETDSVYLELKLVSASLAWHLQPGELVTVTLTGPAGPIDVTSFVHWIDIHYVAGFPPDIRVKVGRAGLKII